jgi:hypothetical protein
VHPTPFGRSRVEESSDVITTVFYLPFFGILTFLEDFAQANAGLKVETVDQTMDVF